MSKVSFLGAGSWGTALAIMLAQNGHDVTLWSKVQAEVDMLIEQYPTICSLDECVQVAFRFARENRNEIQHIFNSANRDIYES